MTVFIEIFNSQLSDGEMTEIKDTVTGELSFEDNRPVLSYEEKKLGGQTAVTLTGSDFVTVKRVNSGFNTEMTFQRGRACECVYFTPYGEIALETKTYSVVSLIEENSGYIELDYDILQGGVKQSHNKMKISFSEEKDV